VIDATAVFYLGISQDTSNVDLGIAEEISIGDFVWSDANDNGLQDAGETGLEGVSVVLRLGNNNVYKNTSTNANGNYNFSNLPRGSYLLEFKLLDGYSSARKQAGDVNADSDINTNGITDLLTLTSASNAVDAGFAKNGSIGNRIWVDLNSNGIQDNGEPGLNGATLKLYDENDNFITETSSSSTQGGIEGIYNFFNVRPGNYYVQIVGPVGYVITRFNIGGAAVNSDLQMDGFTGVFTVLPDEMKEDIDAGFYLPACIGDRVWLDENQNGIQDEGEQGIEGIEVILLRSNGQPLDTVVSDADGKYLFTGLTQGLFSLKFNFENPPYKSTIRDEGEDNLDSDIDSLGNTALISLAHGAKFLDMDAGVYVSNENQFIISDAEENEIQNLKTEVSVYPNPALNDIEINVGHENSLIFIYNTNGKLMHQMKSDKSIFKMSIQEFPAGKYYIFSKNRSGIQQTSFIKFD
jgi:serine-aspartate repeat-containing protein C/D/E